MVTYEKLVKLLEVKGRTVYFLHQEGVISDYSYRKIVNDKPVNIRHLASICLYLGVPIEDIVEIVHPSILT